MNMLVYVFGLIVTALGVALVATILSPLLYALGGYIFGTVLFYAFPFAGIWIASGLRKFGFDIQLPDLPMVFAAVSVLSAYFRSSHTTTVKK